VGDDVALTVRMLAATELDDRLVTRRCEIGINAVTSATDTTATAEAIESLRVLDLPLDDLVATEAVASDAGAEAGPPLVERMILTEERDGTWRVTVSGSDVDRAATVTNATADPVEIADQVLNAVTLRHLFRPAPARLHGGAVARDDGAVALVLGPSGTGKSTMVAHLAAGGLDLLNDEQVALHPAHGVVAAFTRPLVCKPAGAVHLPEPLATTWASRRGTLLVRAADLGTRHRVVGTPALVVIARRDATADPAVEQLGAVEAAKVLMDNNLDLLARPHDALAAFGWLVTTTPVLRVTYRTSAEGAAVVRGLLEAPPEPAGGSWWVWPESTAADNAAPTEPSPMLRAAPHAVGLGFDDGVVLLNTATATATTCNDTAAALWASLPAAAWPEGPEVAAFVSSLREAGLLAPE